MAGTGQYSPAYAPAPSPAGAGRQGAGSGTRRGGVRRVIRNGQDQNDLQPGAAHHGSRLRSVQDAAGDGFGFSRPAEFPVVRVCRILVRGVEPRSSWLLPVAAGIGR
ncbi:hypothetical protein [Streptomyces carminius]|uniref:hypothetical protein n=1 Tax=Streptomyces carminius TaxID=2665496 RepID=UPI0011B8537A|nr:hypothetical protein [Streptomyces carminius]